MGPSKSQKTVNFLQGRRLEAFSQLADRLNADTATPDIEDFLMNYHLHSVTLIGDLVTLYLQ